MALSDESWNQIMRVVLHKAAEAGVAPTNTNAVFGVMRDNWELISKKKQVQRYLAAKELSAKREAHAQALAQAETLAVEIAELKG